MTDAFRFKMTDEQKREVERIVNEKIDEALPKKQHGETVFFSNDDMYEFMVQAGDVIEFSRIDAHAIWADRDILHYDMAQMPIVMERILREFAFVQWENIKDEKEWLDFEIYMLYLIEFLREYLRNYAMALNGLKNWHIFETYWYLRDRLDRIELEEGEGKGALARRQAMEQLARRNPFLVIEQTAQLGREAFKEGLLNVMDFENRRHPGTYKDNEMEEIVRQTASEISALARGTATAGFYHVPWIPISRLRPGREFPWTNRKLTTRAMYAPVAMVAIFSIGMAAWTVALGQPLSPVQFLSIIGFISGFVFVRFIAHAPRGFNQTLEELDRKIDEIGTDMEAIRNSTAILNA